MQTIHPQCIAKTQVLLLARFDHRLRQQPLESKCEYDTVAVGSGPEGGRASTEGEQGSAETTDTTLPRRSHTIQRKGMGLVLRGRMERGLAVWLT